MRNVAAKQFLKVVEHQEPGAASKPHFTSVSYLTDGATDLTVAGDAELRYLFEASTNLLNWTWLGVGTNVTGSIHFTDIKAKGVSNRFYRVLVP